MRGLQMPNQIDLGIPARFLEEKKPTIMNMADKN